MRMSEQLKILDLAPNLANNIETLDLLPIENLDSDLVACQLVYANCPQIRNHLFIRITHVAHEYTDTLALVCNTN